MVDPLNLQRRFHPRSEVIFGMRSVNAVLEMQWYSSCICRYQNRPSVGKIKSYGLSCHQIIESLRQRVGILRERSIRESLRAFAAGLLLSLNKRFGIIELTLPE